MQKIFSPGTKVRVGMEFTQDLRTVGKVYEVVSYDPAPRGFVIDYYIVRDDTGMEHRFMEHLLEEVKEPEVEGATLKELLSAPYGSKAFSPRSGTVLRREKHGWMRAGHGYPLSGDELASYLPVYLVGSFL